MSSVFISFLGTNNYMECRYSMNGTQSKLVKFVQEGIIQLISHKFRDAEKDRVLIFLTDSAKEKNWNTSYGEEGLKGSIEKLGLPVELQTVKIPDGNSEEEIWDIFRILYEQLNEKDEVYLDVTHGFRSLPMLAMVLLNYARFLKRIKVRGIYYGAFESLGTFEYVKERIKPEDRIVPIFNLTPFHTLQMWSGAVENFEKLGDTNTISNLIYGSLNPFLQESKGSDRKAVEERDFAVGFNKIGNIFNTVRGRDLYEGKEHNKLKRQIEKVSNKGVYNYPLEPLIQKISEQVTPYKLNSLKNCYLGVQWCIKNGYIQQGITLLQETIISVILDDIGEEWMDDEYGRESRKVEFKRRLVSSIIKFYQIKDGDQTVEEPEDFCKNRFFVNKVLESEAYEKLKKVFEKLRDYRNNINHAGFLKQIKPGTFESKLQEAFKDAAAWFEKEEVK